MCHVARTLILVVLVTTAHAQTLDTLPLRTKADAERYRTLVNKLGAARLTVDWKDVGIDEAVERLRLEASVNIVLTPAAIDEAADRTLSFRLRNVPARLVIDLLADATSLVFQNRHGVLYVTTMADAIKSSAVLVVYDVAELLYSPPDFPAPKIGLTGSGGGHEENEEPERAESDPQALVDLVKLMTGDEAWAHEGVSIDVRGTKLYVRHTPAMQRRIGGVVRGL